MTQFNKPTPKEPREPKYAAAQFFFDPGVKGSMALEK